MKKTMLLGILSGLLLATVAIAAPANKAPATLKIDAAAKKKAAVDFGHKMHIDKGVACDKCHHTQKGLKATDKTEVKKCAACHTKPEKKGMPNISSASTKKNAYHKNCIGCHKAEKKGPTKCKQCHKK